MTDLETAFLILNVGAAIAIVFDQMLIKKQYKLLELQTTMLDKLLKQPPKIDTGTVEGYERVIEGFRQFNNKLLMEVVELKAENEKKAK